MPKIKVLVAAQPWLFRLTVQRYPLSKALQRRLGFGLPNRWTVYHHYHRDVGVKDVGDMFPRCISSLLTQPVQAGSRGV